MKENNLLSDLMAQKDHLFRLALRITLDRAEAEDVVQDTLVKLWSRRAEWSEIHNLSALATIICRNLALDRNKQACRSNLSLNEQTSLTETNDPPPDVALQRKERLAYIRQQMDKLPEVQRTIMELRDIEGRSYQEIAETMNITEAQVKVYLHRARLKIRTQVSKIEGYGL